MGSLTSEQLAKRRSTNKKIFKFGCLPILIVFAIIMIISIFTPSGKKLSSSQSNTVINNFEIINDNEQNGNIDIDIYCTDTTIIYSLNNHLIQKYNTDKKQWMEINYFDNKSVAKTYMKDQMNPDISEKTKDSLFQYFIAVYKFNPFTGYDKLSFPQK